MKDENIKLDKYPTALELSFWIVVVAAGVQSVVGIGDANIEFWQTRLVAYTKQDAIRNALKQLQSEVPDLYQRGQSIGGWKVTHIEGISAQDMEKMFKTRANLERKLDQDKFKNEHNELLQKIVATKDVNLLHQAIRDGRINTYERAYLHDKLTEGMDESVDELIKSPIQL